MWHYVKNKNNQKWVHGALLQKSRFFLCFEIGERTYSTCKVLISKVHKHLRQAICFVSDGYAEYKKAIEKEFERSIQKITHLMMVKVHKGNRFKEKFKRISIGTKALFNVSGLVTEHIERLFLTMRQKIKCLNRKSLSFSKLKECFEDRMWIFLWNYNYVFYHKTLRDRLVSANDIPKFESRHINKTPAMKEGLVLEKLTMYYLFHKKIQATLGP